MLVHYEEAGDSSLPDIVFVHGAGGSSATWYMQLRGLASTLHVVALDLNGHGQTPDRGDDDVLASYLKDISEVVQQCDRPVLAGHSMGGALAQAYAHQHGDELRGLVLVGTGAKLRVAPMIFEMLDNDYESYLMTLGKFMFHESAPEGLIEATVAEARKCPVSIVRRDFEMCDRFDMMEAVREITTPTLVVVGEGDKMTPVKYAEYLHREIPHSELVVVESAGHAVMLERPTEFNDAVRTWAQRLE